jgi:hypothetical protein
VSGAGEAAAWLAFVLAAWNAGVLGSRWAGGGTLSPGIEASLLLAAAMAVIAWSTWAGALIGALGPSGTTIPIPVAPAYRLAATWATGQGLSLSLAVVGLVAAAMARLVRNSLPVAAARQAFALTAVAVLLLGLIVLDLVPAAGPGIPAYVQAPAAAVAPLAALVAVAALLIAGSAAVASGGAVSGPWHGLVLTAWVAATVALGAEQVARASLGIGPRDAVIAGGAASGLVLWLACSALLHERVRRLLRQQVPAAPPSRMRRAAGWLAHAGAALVVSSFAAHIMAVRVTLELPPGQVVEMSGVPGGAWRLVNQGVSRFDAGMADVTAVAIELSPPAAGASLVTTERREYVAGPGRSAWMSIRGSAGSPLLRLRVLLESVDAGDSARVRVTALPLPVLWDLGLMLLAASSAALVVARWGAASSFAPS